MTAMMSLHEENCCHLLSKCEASGLRQFLICRAFITDLLNYDIHTCWANDRIRIPCITLSADKWMQTQHTHSPFCCHCWRENL